MKGAGAMYTANWKEKRENAYCEITPAIMALKEQWEKKNYIDSRASSYRSAYFENIITKFSVFGV